MSDYLIWSFEPEKLSLCRKLGQHDQSDQVRIAPVDSKTVE